MGAIERLTITVPAEVAASLRQHVEEGDYASTSEIVRETLRDWERAQEADRRELDDVRAAVREGMGSGPSIPADEVFARLEARLQAMRNTG